MYVAYFQDKCRRESESSGFVLLVASIGEEETSNIACARPLGKLGTEHANSLPISVEGFT